MSTININFQGQLIPFETSAYQILQEYLQDLKEFLASKSNSEELFNDFQNRIASLLGNKIKNGTTAINNEDIKEIVDKIGFPEDPTTASQTFEKETKSNSFNFNYSYTPDKKLYRDMNHKAIGGVCAGVANYFNTDISLIRIITILLSSVLFIPYIIMWIVIPPTDKTTDSFINQNKKLFRDMDDKRVAGVCAGLAHFIDLNPNILRVLFLVILLTGVFNHHIFFWLDNFTFFGKGITSSIVLIYIILIIAIPPAKTPEEKAAMLQKTTHSASFATETTTNTTTDDTMMGASTTQPTTNNGSKPIDSFLHILISCIIGFFAVIAILFFGSIAFGGIFLSPYLSFITSSIFTKTLIIIAYVCLTWIPIVGIILWAIRKIFKNEKLRKVRKYKNALFVLGWVALFAAIASLSVQFRKNSSVPVQEIALNTPKSDTILLAATEPYVLNVDEVRDSLPIGNVQFKVLPSQDSSFHMQINRYASADNVSDADKIAQVLPYKYTQRNNLLLLENKIFLTENYPFQNQQIINTIYIPVGKYVLLKNDMESPHFFVRRLSFIVSTDHSFIGKSVKRNVLYQMTADGLKSVGKEWNSNNDPTNTDDDDTQTDDEDATKNSIQVKFDSNVLDDSIKSIKEKSEKLKRMIQLKKEQKELEKELSE